MLRARLVDGALALVCVVAGQVELRHPGSDGVTAGPLWLNSVILLVFGLTLVTWRLAPRACLVGMSLTMLLPSLVVGHDGYFWTTILPLLLVIFRNARSGDGNFARFGWLLAVAALASVAVRTGELVSNLVTVLILFGGCSLVGRLVRRNERQRDQLDVALAELAAEQARREDIAAQTERNRIATEMHDVVAHAVSEMVLQVGAARMGLQAARADVPDQLSAAEATGRQALADLRGSLGLLPDHPDHGLAPIPGVADLERLVAGFREAGLDVRLAPVDDDLLALPSGLQLAIHRVAQEALTNAVKHAGRVRVEVGLERTDDEVVLEVVNAPPEAPTAGLPSGRYGLVGMRERVAVHRGSLEAGPTPAGGWRVHATWPIRVEARA